MTVCNRSIKNIEANDELYTMLQIPEALDYMTAVDKAIEEKIYVNYIQTPRKSLFTARHTTTPYSPYGTPTGKRTPSHKQSIRYPDAGIKSQKKFVSNLH